MAQKKLQKDSEYAHLDLDGDGIVTDEDLDLDERMMRLENEDKKEDAQRTMHGMRLVCYCIPCVLFCSCV